jgi:hypothetical protein
MDTMDEVLEAIDAANTAMAKAVKMTNDARNLAAQAGILTADDIINEGVASARANAFSMLPRVSSYIGTNSQDADVATVNGAKQQVIDAAKAAGQVLALLTKLAMAAAAAA